MMPHGPALADPGGRSGSRSRHRALAISATLALLTAWRDTLAIDANPYLLTPTVVEGERELDVFAGVGSAGSTTGLRRNSAIGVGVGVTNSWLSELAIRYQKAGDAGLAYDAVEWENILALAETNEWPVDVGIVLELELPHHSAEGIETRIGPLLQKDLGNFEINLNLIMDHHFFSDGFDSTRLQYQGQIKYRYREPLEFGLQSFGQTGSRRQNWAAYEQQVHRIGPVVMGHFALPKERGWSYNVGYLLGTTAHSPDRTLRCQIEYEF